MYRTVFFTLSLLTLLLTPILMSQHPPQYVFAQENPSVTPTQSTKLRQMDILMGEHALVTAEMLIARYANQPHFQAARKSTNDNATSLALFIKDFYGEKQAGEFTTIWNKHINSFLKYTDAKKANNQNNQTQAIRELQTFTEDLSNLLSRGDRGMFTVAQNYFSQHVLDEKAIIDAYAAQDYGKMYDTVHRAYLHATSMTEKLR